MRPEGAASAKPRAWHSLAFDFTTPVVRWFRPQKNCYLVLSFEGQTLTLPDICDHTNPIYEKLQTNKNLRTS